MITLPDQGEESKKENEEARARPGQGAAQEEQVLKNKFYQKLRKYFIPMISSCSVLKIQVEADGLTFWAPSAGSARTFRRSRSPGVCISSTLSSGFFQFGS